MQTATIPHDQVRSSFAPVELSIVAHGMARLTMRELAEVRKESLPSFSSNLSPQLLKHSDEQTLASLVALSEAIKSANMTSGEFSDWAIVSSSRNLGRMAFAAVIDKYRDEGPWGVSVQVIPHCTAHAVAGTISLALQSRGPCIGTGGGAGGEIDALLSTASILRKPDWSGAWIVYSAWSPELAFDTAGRPTSDSVCLAAAVAVTKEWSACPSGRIRFDAPRTSRIGTPRTKSRSSSVGLTDFFVSPRNDRGTWSSAADDAVRIRIDLATGRDDELVQVPFAPAIRNFMSDDTRDLRHCFD